MGFIRKKLMCDPVNCANSRSVINLFFYTVFDFGNEHQGAQHGGDSLARKAIIIDCPLPDCV